MKKTLISIIGIIILILAFVCIFKGISFGKLSIYSIKDIKHASLELDNKIQESKTEIDQNYSGSLANVNSAINKLKTTKEEYETKTASLASTPDLGITQIEKYKIEYLWGIIGNYAKDEGLKIDLNIQETTISDTYNIMFTLSGGYVGITNFLYDIENDDELNYQAKDFQIQPAVTETKQTDGTVTKNYDANKLNATFVVENIIINFN